MGVENLKIHETVTQDSVHLSTEINSPFINYLFDTFLTFWNQGGCWFAGPISG